VTSGGILEVAVTASNTQILNIQQNMRTSVQRGQGKDFEQRIGRIRKQQQESTKAAKQVVDVETEQVEEEEEPEWDF